MHKSIAPISLLALVAVSPAQAAPTPITACGTISQSGSYVLTQNLSASSGNCLVIAASSGSVTIDLAGFTIRGNGSGTGITRANGNIAYITVRNGNILGFPGGVDLGDLLGSVVERVVVQGGGIRANGIVKDNQVAGGTNAAGSVTGNSTTTAISVFSSGSTVIGNSVGGPLTVRCPSNVTDNKSSNLVLEGQGCNNTNNNNVAP